MSTTQKVLPSSTLWHPLFSTLRSSGTGGIVILGRVSGQQLADTSVRKITGSNLFNPLFMGSLPFGLGFDSLGQFLGVLLGRLGPLIGRFQFAQKPAGDRKSQD